MTRYHGEKVFGTQLLPPEEQDYGGVSNQTYITYIKDSRVCIEVNQSLPVLHLERFFVRLSCETFKIGFLFF